MFLKILFSLAFTLFSFSALAKTETVLYNAPVKISYTINSVLNTMDTRSDFFPLSDSDCAAIDIEDAYTNHKLNKSLIKISNVSAYLLYIFPYLPREVSNIEVTFHTCKGISK